MRLEKTYKYQDIIQFKWYENFMDEFENPSNFTLIEGIVQSDCGDGVIAYSQENNTSYMVYKNYIIKR